MLVGVISDTHGLLRPEALVALAGVEHILHAGDVGNPEILERLREIAPVTAVRGNVDTHGACGALPVVEALHLDGCFLYMLHVIGDLDLNPRAAGMDVVIYGHSHKAVAERKDGVLYLNPGSAGPQRFSLPITVAILRLEEGTARAEIVELAV